MNDMNPRAVIGANNPPPFSQETVDAHAANASQFVDAAGQWLDLKEITDEAEAARLNDFISGVKKAKKAADDARKAEKKPHDDAGKAVQAAYKPILDKFDLTIKKVAPMLTAHMERKEAERRAEAARQAEEARKAQEEAARLAAQAEARNDIAGEVAAEEAKERAEQLAKDADRAAKASTQVSSATGGGRTASLRTIRKARITNMRVLFMHYQDRPELAECLLSMANADIRSRDVDHTKIPGIEIIEEKVAV